MAITTEDYLILLNDLRFRKGDFYVKCTEDFYKKIKAIPSGKGASPKTKHQLYRLEANIRWHFYRYIENIERSIIAALSTKVSHLQNDIIDNDNDFNIIKKMHVISGDKINPKHQYPRQIKIKGKNIALPKNNQQNIDHYLNYLEKTKIYRNSFDFNPKAQEAIREIRNAIQHFDFIISNKNKQYIKDFIAIFHENYQKSLLAYIINETALTITENDLRIKTIHYIKNNWFSRTTKFIDDFISELELPYKETEFYINNPIDKFNEDRKSKGLEKKTKEQWPDYCKFMHSKQVCEKYMQKLRNDIHKGNISIHKKR